MTKDRITTVIALILCVAFGISLVATATNYSIVISQKDSEVERLTTTIDSENLQISDLQNKLALYNATIESLNTQVSDLQSQVNSASNQIDTLQSQVNSANNQISSLTTQITTLQNQVNDLADIANNTVSSKITTLIFHVSEKGEGYIWGHLPNVTYTYNQILQLNKGRYNILLLPEYEGDLNWTATFAWLRQNFAHIPIVLSVFEGGNGSVPNRQLTIDQILQATATLDVQELRIGEIASWYLARLLPFPTDYISSLLNFTRTSGLKLEWSEWQVNYDAFQRIQSYIKGYEDIVTVTFQTNSLEMEPFDGFLFTSGMFQQWGGSIQSWYWQERGYGSEFDMPTSVLLEHALAARKLGAEILELEPYWYLFDNGEPRENFQVLMAALKSA
jgi:uncharacterized coiled-coil protein SlyX